MLKLYIGNKNYSSWSMRPWVLLRQAGISFEEVLIRFDSFAANSRFKQALTGLSPTGKVPVLVDEDAAGGPLLIWDTMAIAEYVAERFPEQQLWPTDVAKRARARSVCAEMHAGFTGLRGNCPMNIEAALGGVGKQLWREQVSVRNDVTRLVTMWQDLLATHGGPLLFGRFCIADAYFAPAVMRIKTYALPVPSDIGAYVEQVCALPGVRAWVAGALAEHDFLAFEEPYRVSR